MSRLTNLINAVYEGIYYHAIDYESDTTARSLLKIRLWVTFFFYHMGFILLVTAIRVNTFGTYKATVVEALLTVFGLYQLVYTYLIIPRIAESSFNDSPDERRRKKKILFLVIGGGILCCFFSCLVINLLHKK